MVNPRRMITNAGARCYICKLSAPEIMEETIWTNTGDVDVVVAVVVVIGNCDADAVHLDAETGLLGHVGEGAVFVVVIERGKRFALFVVGPVHRVDEQDVLPAVVVVVDEGAARADGFREILLAEGAAVMFEADASFGGNVGEFDRA